jgi:hypothetical protein
MHEKHAGIIAIFKVPIEEKYFVKFYLFDTQEHMIEAQPGEGSFLAKCHTTWFAKEDTGTERMAGAKFADILLFWDCVDPGTLAHEIQHLINSWMEFKELLTDRDDELLALIAEKIHQGFWNQYAERFPSHA